MKKTAIILFILLVCITSGWILLNRSMPTETPEPEKPVIKIGAVLPLSGDVAAIGQAFQQAIQMFENDLASRDTRFAYAFIVEDGQFKPDRSIAAAQKLVNLDHVDALISAGTPINNVVLPITEKNKVLFFASGGFTGEYGSYAFDLLPPRDIQAAALVRELENRNISSVSVVCSNLMGWIDLCEELKNRIEKSESIKLKDSAVVQPSDKDFGILTIKMAAEKPQMIVTLLVSPQLEIFTKVLARQDEAIQTTTIEGFIYPEDKSLFEGKWFMNTPVPTEDYAARFMAYTNTNTTNLSEMAYMALEVLVAAYEKAGHDNEAAAKAIEGHAFVTEALGDISFTANRQLVVEPVVLVIKDGAVVRLEK
ncbi:MAG: ABC transporter substrate-binding protein [Alphaproteobacteria bacterium]|nr:ABC transporter substrate-binding protein [Alphaproteobacteria bacterium]